MKAKKALAVADKTGADRLAVAEAWAKIDALQGAEIEDGKLTLIGTREAMDAVAGALGSQSTEFQSFLLTQLINTVDLVSKSEGNDRTLILKASLAALAGIAPRNEMEAMQAVQMVCAHVAAAEMTRRTIAAKALPQMQAYGNLATKFSRTYAAQAEGLAKMRRNGEQVVKHVHISDNSQAIIAGTVVTGGGGRDR